MKHPYLTKQEFYNEIVLCQQSGIVSELLGTYFLVLCQNIAKHQHFSGYSFKDDIIGESALHCLEIWHKFDTNNPATNPFAWFTVSIFRNNYHFIKKERKYFQLRLLEDITGDHND